MLNDERDEGRGRRKRAPRPLDTALLGEIALAYVARFATSRAKLRHYLARKIRERGWAEDAPADVEAVVARVAGLGFIDDRAFAEAKAGSLLRRGYGGRRVQAALSQSGIEEEDRAGAVEAVEAGAWTAALRFAERRRLGPYAPSALDPQAREKALAAMLRAGHGFEMARRILAARPGEVPTAD